MDAEAVHVVEPLGDLVVGIDHIGVAVADLDHAVTRYRRLFGLNLVHVERNVEQQVVEAMLACPGGSGGSTQLQVLAPLDPASAVGRFLDRRGPGLQHLAFRVRNILEASRILETEGVRLLYDAPGAGTSGSRINFVHPRDACGVLVELVQRAASRGGRPVPDRSREPAGPLFENDASTPKGNDER